MRTVGTDYYSLAINQFGCAFVSTAVNTVSWTQAVIAGKIQEADSIFKIENEGLISPTRVLSEILPQARSVGDLLDVLLSGKSKWMGYNVVLIDSHQACAVETYREHVYVRRLADQDAITNHFQYLDHGPKIRDDYPSSFDRLDYAKESLNSVASIQDIFEIVNPMDDESRNLMWRQGTFTTVSSSIIDVPNFKIYHCQKDGSYQVYSLDAELMRAQA